MLCTLILKLPTSVGDRWNRKVQFTRKYQLTEPDLVDFTKFADEKTEVANDPLYSQEAVDNTPTGKKEKERSSARGIGDSRHSITTRLNGEEPYQGYKERCNLCYVC